MVGVAGIGPATSSLSGTRSNQLSYTPGCDDGGGNGTRTRDFQLAKLALYQLSYAPGRLHRPAAGEPRFPRFAGRSGKASILACVRQGRNFGPLPGLALRVPAAGDCPYPRRDGPFGPPPGFSLERR